MEPIDKLELIIKETIEQKKKERKNGSAVSYCKAPIEGLEALSVGLGFVVCPIAAEMVWLALNFSIVTPEPLVT